MSTSVPLHCPLHSIVLLSKHSVTAVLSKCHHTCYLAQLLSEHHKSALTMAVNAVLLHGPEPGSISSDIQCG